MTIYMKILLKAQLFDQGQPGMKKVRRVISIS